MRCKYTENDTSELAVRLTAGASKKLESLSPTRYQVFDSMSVHMCLTLTRTDALESTAFGEYKPGLQMFSLSIKFANPGEDEALR